MEQRSRPQAIVQISRRLLIWIMLQGLFAIPAILGPLRQALDQIVITRRDGSSMLTFSPNTSAPVRTALSRGGWAGAMRAASGLLTILSLLVGTIVFAAILLVEVAAGWARLDE